MEEVFSKEFAYEQWQILYARRRRRTLLGILDARSLHLAKTFRKNVANMSNAWNYRIEIRHSTSDPGTWIVRYWRKYLCFKKRISSTWFNDERQAISFANRLKGNHDEH